jgi:hypothetical protein
MNVELVNPTLVLGLLAISDAAEPRFRPSLAPAWAKQVRAHLDERLRYQHALHELHQLDDREFDELDLARADVPAAGAANREAYGAVGSSLTRTGIEPASASAP